MKFAKMLQKKHSSLLENTDVVLKEKTKLSAEVLGVNDFTCSSGWLSSFKEHDDIVTKRIHGEESSINQNSVDLSFSKRPFVKKYHAPHEIFNADETGLFFL